MAKIDTGTRSADFVDQLGQAPKFTETKGYLNLKSKAESIARAKGTLKDAPLPPKGKSPG